MKFTNTVVIGRPTADVFAYLAELENIPRWNYAISETRKAGDGPVGVGARYVQQRTLPAPAQEEFEVVEFEAGRRLALDGRLGPFASRAAYVLEPVDGGTSLTNTMELRPSGLLRVAAPLAVAPIKAAVARNLVVLKEILENS